MASTTVAIMEAVLRADTKGFDAAMGRSETRMQKVGKAAGVAGLAIAAGLAIGAKVAVDAAVDLNETINKTEVVFGDSAAAVEAWADTTATSIGTSKQAALEGASSFGLMFTQMGFGEGNASKLSQRLVTLSADLGSFNNASQPEIQEAMSAAFRGEYDSLQKFVPTINAAAVQQQALIETGKKNVANLTAQEKAQATYTLMMEGTKKAQGDFERTSGSLANQQKILRAQLEDLAAKLGAALIPALTKVAAVTQSVIAFFSKHETMTKALIIALGALAVALLAASVAQTLLNLAFLANPIVAMVVAIGALIVAFVILYKKFDFVRKHWHLLLFAFGLLPGIIAIIVRQVINHWDQIKGAVIALKDAVVGAWNRVKEITTSVWGSVASFVKDKVADLKRIFGDLKQAATDAFNWIADKVRSILGPFQTAVSWAERLLGVLRDIGNAPTAPAGPGAFHHPQGASGGIVTRPTLAMIGEAGPEAVVPLSRTPGSRSLAGLGGPVQINLHLGGRQIASALVDLDQRQKRQGGRGFL